MRIKFFKKYYKPTGELTNKECKFISSMLFFPSIIIVYILSFIISFISKRDMLILFITGIMPSFYWFLNIFFIYDLNKYFDIIKGGKETPLGTILRLIMFGVGFTFLMTWFVYVISNSLSLGFSFGFGSLYPGIFMFFRRNSCWSETHTDGEGNLVYTYDVAKYWRNSLTYCIFISLGLIQVSLALINNSSIIFPVIWTVCAVILVSLVLSPDITHKILPFKNERTFELFDIVVSVVLLVFLILFAILINH